MNWLKWRPPKSGKKSSFKYSGTFAIQNID
jgi:hypothetical protein